MGKGVLKKDNQVMFQKSSSISNNHFLQNKCLI